MFHKLSTALVCSVVLVAFAGFSTSAYALIEPACEPDNNEFGIYDFSVDTPDSHRPRVVSGMSVEAVLCGTEVRAGSSYDAAGAGSQFVRFDVKAPLGVAVNPTDQMDRGAFVGSARVNLLTWLGTPLLPFFLDADAVAPFVLRVASKGDGDCPTDAVACYKEVLDGALIDIHNWVWVTGDEESGYTMTIGEFYYDTFPGTPVGLTRIREFSLCGYAGDVGDEGIPGECGDDSRPWLQKNGKSTKRCPYRGRYTATATTRDGRTTPRVEAFVNWTDERPSPKPFICGKVSGTAILIDGAMKIPGGK